MVMFQAFVTHKIDTNHLHLQSVVYSVVCRCNIKKANGAECNKVLKYNNQTSSMKSHIIHMHNDVMKMKIKSDVEGQCGGVDNDPQDILSTLVKKGLWSQAKVGVA